MATAPTNPPATNTVVGRVPYLNCAPFFHGLILDDSWEWADLPPRQLGTEAQQGRLIAGPMSLVDYLRLQDRFERVGPLGIAVRGRCGSVMLFARKPLRLIDEATTIAVTDETSTAALLLRLILEQRYQLTPNAYQRGRSEKADAVLLIGDEALTFQATNRAYPFEIDLAFEWWLWQHLPAVFAVWTIRTDCPASDKQYLSRSLQQQLARNLARLDVLAAERAGSLGVPAEQLKSYLENFVYRFSESEEQAIKRFEQLLQEHRLL